MLNRFLMNQRLMAPEAEGGSAAPAPAAPDGTLAAATPPQPDASAPPADGATPPVPPAEPKAPEPPKAPAEQGTFDFAKVKLPEGVTLDEAGAKNFVDLLNDTKLSRQELGEKLVSFYSDAVKAIGAANMESWQQTNKQWVDSVKSDKDIGGDKLPAAQSLIAKMIDTHLPGKLGTELRQALDMTGAGNHPAVVKGMWTLAGLLTEGGHVNGSPVRSGQMDIKTTFFPNSPDMR